MLRSTVAADFSAILAVINDAAVRYRGAIPADCWREPYMPEGELRDEIAAGVRFWGAFDGENLIGVMGLQDMRDVTLFRHAYVCTAFQGRGVGSALLNELMGLASQPVLIGTWAAATWAVHFYERHGFARVTPVQKDRLLRDYWSISDRQVETSVVLADARALELIRRRPYNSG